MCEHVVYHGHAMHSPGEVPRLRVKLYPNIHIPTTSTWKETTVGNYLFCRVLGQKQKMASPSATALVNCEGG